MASGDYKKRRTRYSGGSKADADKRDRDDSQREFDKVRYSDNPIDFLNGLDDQSLVRLYRDTSYINRRGDLDWNRIVRMLPEGEKEGWVEKVTQAQERLNQAAKERADKAEVHIKENKESMKDEARLTSGYLQSELAAAIKYKESYGNPYGDWLDDPVAAVTGQGGFGEEIQYSTGIRLEVNLALDCSNSMYYNGLRDVAVNVFRDMYWSLLLAAKNLPDDSLTVNAFAWAKGEDGKDTRRMSQKTFSSDENYNIEDKGDLAGLDTIDAGWYFDGEDTWLHPLLGRIERWEQRYGDPGAFRLDIVITDGVLEHATDPRKCDAIQERRNGNLQSVMLNFLPMEEWGDYRVPNRFVQYEATVENIGSLMRSILGDWVVGV